MNIFDLLGTEELPAAFGRGIVKGSIYHKALLRDTPALQRFTGRYLRSHLLHACTDYAISNELSEITGLSIVESSNMVNYTFLEIQTENFTMTTSLMNKKNGVPRNARFRINRATSNPYLFPEMEAERLERKPYLIFTHGRRMEKRGNEIVFEELYGGIGMPCADNPSHWELFERLDNYINEARAVPEELIDEQNEGFSIIKKKILGKEHGIA